MPANVTDRTAADAHLAEVEAEQAALRRIATLLARSVPPNEVFDAVVDEVRLLMRVDGAVLGRYEADKTVTVLAVSAEAGAQVALPVDKNVHGGAQRRPLGIEHRAARTHRRLHEGDRQGSGTPVPRSRCSVGRGCTRPASRTGVGGAFRLLDAGATTPGYGGASRGLRRAGRKRDCERAGVVGAGSLARADHQRRRRGASAGRARPPRRGAAADCRARSQGWDACAVQAAQTAGLDADLRSFEVDLNEVLEELRTIASGLHPAALSEGGLAPALRTLARRSPVPVVLDVRLPGGVAESVEVAAYYFVAETLTNTTKHAEASRIDVTVELRDGHLWVCVRDDGVGGADPTCGSGLVGLKDRIEAFGGTMTLDSPSGGGTTLVAQSAAPSLRQAERTGKHVGPVIASFSPATPARGAVIRAQFP